MNGAGLERYLRYARSGSCEATVQTEDWLCYVLEDKKICKMIIDERCKVQEKMWSICL